MEADPKSNATMLIQAASRGEEGASDQLLPLLYEKLRELADSYLRREAAGHTLVPTALVHEAYLKLVDQTQVDWQGRTHFYAVAAMAMRRILTDHARAKKAEKRGGGWNRVTLDRGELEKAEVDVRDLLDVLADLRAKDELAGRIVELRFFAGMTEPEVAHALGYSERKIRKEWAFARVWLRQQLREGGDCDA